MPIKTDFPIHQNKKFKSLSEKKGFSLMEIMIVLVIIGAVVSLVGVRVFDKSADTRKVLRDFTVAGKDLKGKAKMNSSTYRLAFQLDGDGREWWVEKSTGTGLIDKKKIDEERERAKKQFQSEEDQKKKPDFAIDTSIFKKRQLLPAGFRFKQVESASQDAVFTEGTAYIHFFSQGLIETAALQLTDNKKNTWTIVYNPITGQTDLIPEAKSLKDLAR